MASRDHDIRHLERLAHLDLDPSMRALLAERLERLLAWCEVLPESVDDPRSDGVPAPPSRPRADEVAPSPGGAGLPLDDPRSDAGFVATPPPSGRCDDGD